MLSAVKTNIKYKLNIVLKLWPLNFLVVLLSFSAQAELSAIGYPRESRLNFKVSKACVGTFMRNISPGPYGLKIYAFKGVLDQKAGVVSRVKTKIIRDALYVFSDYKTVDRTSSSVTIDRLKASLGLPLPPKGFEFKNFDFSLSVHDVARATAEIRSFSKMGFLDSIALSDEKKEQLSTVVGLKLKVVDRFTNAEVFHTLIAFPNPDQYTGDSLLDDLPLRENSKLQKLWPKVAIQMNSYRPYFVRSGKHEGGDDQSCRSQNYLAFSLKIED